MIKFALSELRRGIVSLRDERGGIDDYVTKAVMIFLAIAGAVVLISLNSQLFGWVTNLVGSLTSRQVPS